MIITDATQTQQDAETCELRSPQGNTLKTIPDSRFIVNRNRICYMCVYVVGEWTWRHPTHVPRPNVLSQSNTRFFFQSHPISFSRPNRWDQITKSRSTTWASWATTRQCWATFRAFIGQSSQVQLMFFYPFEQSIIISQREMCSYAHRTLNLPNRSVENVRLTTMARLTVASC